MLGTFRIGADIALALDVTRGDPDEVVSVTAMMAPVYREGGPAKGAASEVEINPREGSGDDLGGWVVRIPAADSAALAPGVYGIDVQFVYADDAEEITSRTGYITLTRAVIA